MLAALLMAGLMLALPIRADSLRQTDKVSEASDGNGNARSGASFFDSELSIGLLIVEPDPGEPRLMRTQA